MEAGRRSPEASVDAIRALSAKSPQPMAVGFAMTCRY
jgi:hypothetical protein